jgi:hypothetical protein
LEPPWKIWDLMRSQSQYHPELLSIPQFPVEIPNTEIICMDDNKIERETWLTRARMCYRSTEHARRRETTWVSERHDRICTL